MSKLGPLTQAALGEITTELAELSKPGHHMSHNEVTDFIMERAAKKGLTLSQLGHPLVLKRKRRTLQRHAQRLGLTFPDYTYKPRKKKIDEPQDVPHDGTGGGSGGGDGPAAPGTAGTD